MELGRRRLLMNGLFGAGLIGLRSLATGIPASILLNPREALARARRAPDTLPSPTPQYVILSTSGEGDPISCNGPGTYLDSNILHPQQPSMAATALTIGGQSYTAALPWSTLPQTLLDRSCFFHHGTYTVVHSDEEKVQQLNGYSVDNEMLISLLAAQLGPALGTVQSEPIVLGPRNFSEVVVYQKRPQPIVQPSALSLLLSPPSGPLGNLTALRDHDLDRLNALIKSEGTPAQAAFIDRYVQSQAQVRSISDTLLSTLATIRDDGMSSQIKAAVTLIRMNVAPVVSLHIPFGGDNHGDGGLNNEAMQTVSGMASINQLWTLLNTYEMQDRVSFLSFNVFGRTMNRSYGNGRAHNGNHHLAYMFGSQFKGSVIGGVQPMSGDFGATSINSTTGLGVANGGGDVAFGDTLQSMARTFGKGVGVNPTILDQGIRGGKVIGPALTLA